MVKFRSQNLPKLSNSDIKIALYCKFRALDKVIQCKFSKPHLSNGVSHNYFHNILRLFDVLANFPLTTIKRYAIFTYNHCIYELPHQLPNDLKT